MSQKESEIDYEPLYNQVLSDEDISRAIRRNDLDDMYSDRDQPVEAVRDQLDRLEPELAYYWSELVEDSLYPKNVAGPDEYVTIATDFNREIIENALENAEFGDSLDEDEYDTTILTVLISEASNVKRPDYGGEFIFPLPDGVTKDDVLELAEMFF